MLKKRRPRRALLAAAAAVGISGTLVFGHATDTTAENLIVRLTNTVIAAGGQGNPTSDRVQFKLNGTVVPAGFGYDPINYPATINLSGSRDIGIPLVRTETVTHGGEQFLIVAGYSEGTLIAEQVRRDLQATPAASAPSDKQLTFLMIASPFAGNGGILARFPWLTSPGSSIPWGRVSRRATTRRTSRTSTTPTRTSRPTSTRCRSSIHCSRSATRIPSVRSEDWYDPIDPATAPQVQHVVQNSAGGTDTYVMFLNPHLPLFGPIREVSGLLSLTPLTEPMLGAIEPLFRLAIDMSYTDRTYANPETPTPFSLITPPAKVIEALLGVPGALAEGLTNLLSGGQSSLGCTQSVIAMAAPAPAPEAPEAGTQRRALAAVAEPKVEAKPSSVDTGLTADAKPQAVEADTTVGDTTVAEKTVAEKTVADTAVGEKTVAETVGEKTVAEKKNLDAQPPRRTTRRSPTRR